MKIGIDFDGVIIDSERRFRYHCEKHMYEQYGREPITRSNRDTRYNYDFSGLDVEGVLKDFLVENFFGNTAVTPFLEGVAEVLNDLRAWGHELYLVTARGEFGTEIEVETAKEKLRAGGIVFDHMFFGVTDKAKLCRENGIDIMVDDCNRNCARLAAAGVKTLYFRNLNIEELTHPNITEVDNWFHIYKEICNLDKILG